MKIAYILEVDPYINSGIIKKVNGQIALWRKNGHEIYLMVIWSKSKNGRESFLEGPQEHFRHFDGMSDGFVKNYLNKIVSVTKVQKTLNELSPDLIYIRQNIWYPGINKILRSHKVVLEINSVDFMELQYSNSFRRAVYNYGKKKILRDVNAIVAVTPDILKHYKDLGIKCEVVSNGIDLDKFDSINHKILDQINLVFVGSGNMAWHGVDKVLEMARMLPQYNFFIVGYEADAFPEVNSNNVSFFGWVEKKELQEIYSKCHFGIGSFGNHLVGKRIDSTLKIREYLAIGLPVISGHFDVDFMDSKFVKKVTDENHEFIDVHSITGFIEEYSKYVVPRTEIQNISAVTKEGQRLCFFQNVVNG